MSLKDKNKKSQLNETNKTIYNEQKKTEKI